MSIHLTETVGSATLRVEPSPLVPGGVTLWVDLYDGPLALTLTPEEARQLATDLDHCHLDSAALLLERNG